MPVFPVFLKLEGRRVLVVGAGPVAAGKIRPLLDAGAAVKVVAPEIVDEVATLAAERGGDLTIVRRAFQPADVEGAWYVVAAAPPEVNREVARAAEARCLFVNAVDDLESATAYAGAIVHKAGVTIAMSTDGEAPALAGLMREALEVMLPDELDRWMQTAREARRDWLARNVPMAERRPLLLEALNELYEPERPASTEPAANRGQRLASSEQRAANREPRPTHTP
jgi:uroporphyrin-III C-methyltransferase/precorrin-2 dehydrogenase/sirohydrochlorin ferrochelatase